MSKYEYTLKNTYLEHGSDYQEEDRKKYGFNPSGEKYVDDKDMEDEINYFIVQDMGEFQVLYGDSNAWRH